MGGVPLYQDILRNIDLLPDSARIPVPVASLVQGISRHEIRKRYPMVKIGKRREGVLLGHLRGKQEVTTA